jgi:hypothetical protein
MFDIHQSIFDRTPGEIDERRLAQYIDALMEEFAASPEAAPILEQYGGLSWTVMLLEFAGTYLGVSVPKLSLRDFNEILFELFPRKVSTEAASASAIVAELRAFWSFLHRQYGLANARKILDTLTDAAAQRLHEALSNPANFGMAKSFFMLGSQAGFDMTTQEGMDQFRLAYNSALVNNQGTASPFASPFEEGAAWGLGLEPASPPPSKEERAKKRQARKAQRQARKRNRK